MTNIKWSNTEEGWVPKVGERIEVTMNGLGFGTVVGYFISSSGPNIYLGVAVKLENPPKWFTDQIKRNKYEDSLARVYGAEVRRVS